MRSREAGTDLPPIPEGSWPALWALVIGFFMILVDSTIVSVATDSIMVGLHTDLNNVVWVTSAYLLAYVVPLLVSGRLGDRFGPKRVYLTGLMLFTLASALCGFAGSITCALFLQRFVEATTSWLHVDIYGWTPAAKPARPEGGECQAARAIYRLLDERYG